MSSKPGTLAEVVAGGLCTGCGLCASLAGSDKVKMGLSMRGHMRPYAKEPLEPELNTRIMAVCPGAHLTGPETPSGRVEDIWGPVLELHRSWSRDPAVRHTASAGGTLTALGRYLLASGDVQAILHVRASASKPWLTDAVVSVSDEEVIAGAQSRYGPAAPLVHVHRLLEEGLRFAVIAKPCDISAVRALARSDGRVDQLVPYLLTNFCGGVPSMSTTSAIMRYHGVEEQDVAVFRYRGEGWPGPLRVLTRSGEAHDLPYGGAWIEKPWKYDKQFRCKICPDSIGEVADIAVPDGWLLKSGKPLYDEAPGVNALVVRTANGRQLVSSAVAAGYLELAPLSLDELALMHQNHRTLKLAAPAQLLAMRVARQTTPVVSGYRLGRLFRIAGLRLSLRRFLGTVRRIRAGDNREPLI